jgi:two-component system, LuxR family, sensor kinase FixL
MLPLERLWDRPHRVAVLTASAAMILAIALADWWTVPFVSLGFLYLFPVVLAAGFLPRSAILALGLICAALTELFSSLGPPGRVSRLVFETLGLAGSGLFVSELLRHRCLTVENRERLRTLVETSPAAIVTVDQRGVVELANQAAAELLAPAGSGLVGHPIASFLPELQTVLDSGAGMQFRTSMECEAHKGNGEPFVAEVWFSTCMDNGAAKLAAIVADVTEEHAAAPSKGQPRLEKSAPFNARQIAVLRLVLRGLTNREIASQLEVTGSAVKNTLQQIFSQAGVNNRSQLVRVVLERYRDLL